MKPGYANNDKKCRWSYLAVNLTDFSSLSVICLNTQRITFVFWPIMPVTQSILSPI